MSVRGFIADGDTYTAVPLDQIKAEVTARKAILVDVREQREWDQGHIGGAVFVPLSQLIAWDRDGLTAAERAALEKTLPKGSVVYCHCAAGGRALPGGESLTKLGYDTRPLRLGYRTLIEAGFPRLLGPLGRHRESKFSQDEVGLSGRLAATELVGAEDAVRSERQASPIGAFGA
jgi:phage shock protein E